ncbi:hypothetical protein H7849_11935 [Alloacidobacterium dinghuense]|uniref:Uncharacterized protein n=1 Tax=Alloacidobacterium dinghuense TaxID=2763107 RepID=A0A7G8BPR6_9BACT|nr:hypothetical protein [Alloacidobacterium dinghuense]QNI34536.1 hypothetical protein H7849_11935 [Alloacidobacterium dinghuense]
MAAIELTAPRIIVIEDDRRRQYQFTVARIAKKQWLRYFEGIVSTSENQDGKRLDSFDSSAARLELAEQVLADAKGYKSEKPVTEIAGWQKLLPLSHRLGVANALIDVRRSDKAGDDDEPIRLGDESITLDAVWGADESGVMRKYHGLRHNFQTPSAEHQRRFSRDASRSVIVGGSRSGKTRWLGAQATLIELYDELIQSVDGYTVSGAMPDRAAIVEYMDAYHKVAAADQLFSPAAPKLSEEEQ